MADSEDAAVNDVKPASREPMIDCVTIDPGIEELGACNHPVLTLREARDDGISASSFTLPGYARVN